MSDLLQIEVFFGSETRNGCFDVSHAGIECELVNGQYVTDEAKDGTVLLVNVDGKSCCEAKLELITGIPYARPISKKRSFQKG